MLNPKVLNKVFKTKQYVNVIYFDWNFLTRSLKQTYKTKMFLSFFILPNLIYFLMTTKNSALGISKMISESLALKWNLVPN